MKIRAALIVALLALGLAPAARAWGLVGHAAISQKAAERLGLPPEQQYWFALGGVMGDLDKSDLIRRQQSSPLMKFLATLGNSYQFPSLVDQHDPAHEAELLEACGRTGDPRLEAFALGVLSHRRADRFKDTYPDPRFAENSGIGEITMDCEIFRPAENGRFKDLLAKIEGDDAIIYSPAKHIPWTWWLYLRSSSLRNGHDHDADVRAVDPFAQLIFDAWHRSHATGGPASVSDVWRQQAAFDAFTWNYRLKGPLYPGRADFVRSKGAAWFVRMQIEAFTEIVPAIVTEAQAWQAHLARLRAGAPSQRPQIP